MLGYIPASCDRIICTDKKMYGFSLEVPRRMFCITIWWFQSPTVWTLQHNVHVNKMLTSKLFHLQWQTGEADVDLTGKTKETGQRASSSRCSEVINHTGVDGYWNYNFTSTRIQRLSHSRVKGPMLAQKLTTTFTGFTTSPIKLM